MEKVILTVHNIEHRILSEWGKMGLRKGISVYGIPRGGWNIAYMLEKLGLATQVALPQDADMFVDDIIDSGGTRKKWKQDYPDHDFWAPFNKVYEGDADTWFVFPWEGSAKQDGQELVTRMLQMIGEDPMRDGLKGTPERVVRSWHELFSGYGVDVDEILHTTFPSTSKDMVMCRDIEFYSMCEHHMIPFFGSVSVAYIPDGQVVGLSKIARAVEVYARRLQIQEQLGEQVADAILKSIPKVNDVAVTIKAKHLCMCGRGVNKQNSSMVTSALRGKFREDAALRAEFLSLLSI